MREREEPKRGVDKSDSAHFWVNHRERKRERRERRVTRDTYYVTSICVLYHAKIAVNEVY